MTWGTYTPSSPALLVAPTWVAGTPTYLMGFMGYRLLLAQSFTVRPLVLQVKGPNG